MQRKAIAASVIVVFLCSVASLASAATLGVSDDGRFFTIDGVPTYLNGVSYYGALTISTPSFVTGDLDDMVAGGFNWIRVWAFWEYPDPSENVSIMTSNGGVREPYMTRLKTLIAECNNRGMIVVGDGCAGGTDRPRQVQ